MDLGSKQPAGRWTIYTLILAVIVVIAGAGLYADALIAKTSVKGSASADSCPLPGADYSKKERKIMTTAVRKEIVPLIDRALPAKTETATFGLG